MDFYATYFAVIYAVVAIFLICRIAKKWKELKNLEIQIQEHARQGRKICQQYYYWEIKLELIRDKCKEFSELYNSYDPESTEEWRKSIEMWCEDFKTLEETGEL